MFGLGPTELIIIGVIVLLIFGAKRLPEIGKGLGGAVKELKNVKREISEEAPQSDESPKKEKKDENTEHEATYTYIEQTVRDKALGRFPGVGKVMDAKKKAEKIKDIIK